MWKQCGCLVLLSAVLALIPGGAASGAFDILKDPALVGWWSCDDGTGTTVADSSANKRNGTVVNGTAIWVPGIHGGAIELKGPVVVQIKPITMQMTQGTMAGWIKRVGAQPDWSSFIMHRAATGATNASGFNIVSNGMAYHWQDASNTWSYRPGAAGAIPNNEWTFCAVTVQPDRAVFYLNGNAVATNFVTHLTADWNSEIYLGGDGTSGYVARRLSDGMLDDVSLFSRALSASEIKDIMGQGIASNPVPGRNATDVPQDAALAWSAAPSAGTHDVYFGTVQADVDAASRTDKKGVLVSQGQADATFKPTLEYGKTYYWRIDEVAKDNTILKGSIWSFTVEPYGYSVTPTKATASSAQANMGPENTINGSGMKGDLHGNVETTMWLSTGAAPNWIQYEFDKVYKLHEMLVWNSNQQIEMMLGFGAKTVTVETSVDGTTWTAVKNVPEFARAPGTPDYASNTTVNMGEVDAKFVKLTITANWGGLAPQTGLSEVRFTQSPVQARSAVPANNTRGVAVDAKLDWRPGREATSHKVFFGTDADAVANGTVAAKTVATHAFDPGALILDTFYYWRVDEVGNATYPGSVWNFTTQQFKPIDNFESYTDQAGGEIFSAWIDGYSTNFKSSGSTVGNKTAVKGTFSETSILHGGSQSMPFDYNNTKAPFFSEATRTFDTPQDWTANGANTLDLWFKGFPLAYLETATGVTLSGAGADIYQGTNQFRYAYKQLTGDGSITVRVDSVRPVAAWSKSGVMIRAGLNPLDMYVHMITAGAQNLVEFMYRPTVNVAATTQFNAPVGTNPLPVWLRLTRAGNVFTGETSTDGQTWTKLTVGTNVSTQTLTMPATVYVGFAVDAGATTGAQAVADFSQISTTGTVSAGSWQVADVGLAMPSNSPAPMYLVVEDKDGKKATVAYPDPAATNVQVWRDWRIALSDLKGINVAAVKKLTIGVGDGKAVGAGKLYIDDIQTGRVPTAVDPGTANLVALWALDGDAKDSSGKGNDGTTTGAVQWVPGHTGQALKLLGNGTWVDCGTGASLNCTDAVTITAWIRLAAVGADRKIAGNQDNVGGGYKMGVYSSNKVEIEIRNAANKTFSNRNATGGTVLQADEWYPVAAVYAKGQYLRTYVFGSLDRETTTTETAGSSKVSFKLGRETYGTGGTWWLGLLDDVRVYNKALSEGELLWLAGK